MWTVLLPPGVNRIAFDKYIISYRIVKWSNCASSWSFTKVILRSTVSKTSKKASRSSHIELWIFSQALRFPLVWSECLHSTTECYKRRKKIFKVHWRLEHARVLLDNAVQFLKLLACQQEQDIPILKLMINVSYCVLLYYIAQQGGVPRWHSG